MTPSRTRHASGDHIISIVPIEVCMDHRLTLTQIRVLVALFSFRNKDTGVAKVKRSTLSERCGYPETRISKTTSELVNLGWILKEGKGGFSQPSSYQVTTPDLTTITKLVTVQGGTTVTEHVTVSDAVTVTEPVTVTHSVTVTEPVTTTVTEPVTPTVTKPVTRIKRTEQSNEQSNEQSYRGKPSLMVEAAVLTDDWLAIATGRGMTKATALLEFEKFKLYHLEKKTVSDAWGRQWSRWCLNWVSYGANQAGGAGGKRRHEAPEDFFAGAI